MNDNSPHTNSMSSSAPASFAPFFRRRTLGRAPSPPTWACYEQIPPPGSDSDDDGDSVHTDSDSQSGSDSEVEDEHESRLRDHSPSGEVAGDMEMEMQMAESVQHVASEEKMDVDVGAAVDGHACGSTGEQCDDDDCEQPMKRQDKGKQRAVDPEPEPLQAEKTAKRRHHRRKHHESPILYRPILTIKKSEGFVWNQDLFIPSYIKDRYVASTSPPSNNLNAETSTISPIPASELQDSYEIEVVEIRVQGNELDGIL